MVVKSRTPNPRRIQVGSFSADVRENGVHVINYGETVPWETVEAIIKLSKTAPNANNAPLSFEDLHRELEDVAEAAVRKAVDKVAKKMGRKVHSSDYPMVDIYATGNIEDMLEDEGDGEPLPKQYLPIVSGYDNVYVWRDRLAIGCQRIPMAHLQNAIKIRKQFFTKKAVPKAKTIAPTKKAAVSKVVAAVKGKATPTKKLVVKKEVAQNVGRDARRNTNGRTANRNSTRTRRG